MQLPTMPFDPDTRSGHFLTVDTMPKNPDYFDTVPTDVGDLSTMTHQRSTDSLNLRVSREIPLWGIITALAIFAGQAISVYYNQVAQGKDLATVQQTATRIDSKLESVVTAQTELKLKDVERDMRITMLTNRIAVLENALQRPATDQRYPRQ